MRKTSREADKLFIFIRSFEKNIMNNMQNFVDMFIKKMSPSRAEV